jgi:drug/metabolite transporter (DMT)-like permease
VSPAANGGARRGIVRCAAAAVLFGATTPLASRLADDTTAPMLAGLLYVGAALAVAPIAGRQAVDRSALRRGLGPLSVAVVAGGFLGPLLLTAGLSRTPAATASLLLNLELVATAVLAALLFQEHLGSRVLLGTAAVVLAGVLLVWTDVPELRLGALLIVGACTCWGLDNCVTAELDEISPEHITLAKGGIAGTTNIGIGLALGAAVPSAGVVLGGLAIGAVGYGASITLWVAGARDLGAARGQLVFSAAPFVGVLVAWAVLGDPVRLVEAAAVVVAVFGVSRVLGSQHHHTHHHHALEHDHEHVHDDAHHDHTHDEGSVAPAGSVGVESGLRHGHRHRHEPTLHAHPHVPDLHHRHAHEE